MYNKLKAMKKNMSGLDRTLRILVAIAIGILYFTNVISGTLAIILLIIAGIFIITGFVGVCPLYSLLGISTCKVHEHTGKTA